MLDSATQTDILNAFSDLMGLVAGDTVYYYASQDATEGTELTTIMYDVLRGDGVLKAGDGGVAYGPYGSLEHAFTQMLFLKSTLEDAGVELDPTGFWVIDNERWDFAPKEPIYERTFPICGLHPFVQIHIVKASEYNAWHGPIETGSTGGTGSTGPTASDGYDDFSIG